MAQNRYDRSYDNDRAPAPEKTLKSRLRYFRIRCSEQLEELISPFRKASKRRKERAVQREIEREEARVAQERDAALQEEAAQENSTARVDHYGKDDFTQQNHATGSDILVGRESSGRKRRRIALTGRCWGYLVLLIAAFISTQALHAKASNIFLGFVVFLPPVLLLYTLTSLRALQMHMASDGATVKKLEPYTYQMRLMNQSPFAYPFVEAIMYLPQSNSVRCSERSVYLSMTPFGSYELCREVRFRFRGSYEIGVECFYVYDFFRLFRVRVDVGSSVAVRVLPRRMRIGDEPSHATSDEPDLSSHPFASVDRVEIGDIRSYLPGDPLKLIHWNLTSRSEEPVVKDFHGGRTKTTYVYCDLAARFPDEPPAELTPTKRELKRAKRDEKERRDAERRKKKAISYAEKHGDPLSEEDLLVYGMTKTERRISDHAKKREKKRERQLLRLEKLQKKDPLKAAMLRDKLKNEEHRSAEETRGKGASEGVLDVAPNDRDENAQLLADPSYYEDMNEYCADGIVDLSLSAAHREIARGNEVVLIWQDRRSHSGICAYSFRSADELKTVYPLFATAPLCQPSGPLAKLSAFAGDTSGVKQIFVTAALDRESVSAFCDLPSFGGAGSGCELVLYDPEERFLYPEQRRAYIGGCREELMGSGITLISEKSVTDPGEGGEA